MAHAKLSPSSSDRWIACPGSVHAVSEITEPDTGNAASMEGTVAHSLLQLCLAFNIRDTDQFIGTKLEGGDHPRVDQAMADGVRVALSYIDEHVELYGKENVIVHPERWVRIGPMIDLPEELCNGTSDAVIEHVNGSLCVVMDYKHGKGVAVDAKENSQMRLYAAGVTYEANRKFKEYKNVIVQPRIARRSPVQEETITHGRLLTWLRDKVKPSAHAALLDNAPRTAGEHCRFCRASANCQTYRRRARAVAANEFGEIEDPESIPNAALESILEEAVVLENWVKAVRVRALHYLQNGGRMANFMLGWSKRTRQWDEAEKDELVAFLRKQGVPLDEYMPRSLVSPKQATDILKRRKLMPKDVNPIEAFVTYSIPKAAIVPKGEDLPDAIDD